MGSDIHLVLEQKQGRGGWIGIDSFRHKTNWIRDAGGKFRVEYISTPARERNYNRFAALAGVRGDGPIPNGVPDNASELARLEIERWVGDGHSHSYLPLRDAVEVYLATESDPENVFLREDDPRKRDPYDYWFGVDRDEPLDDYRVVFWFDN